MASRRMFQFQYSLERELSHIHMKVAIGASGAPTLSRALGVASMVRNSAGNYTITLQDKWNLLMNVEVMQVQASGAMAAPLVNVVSESVASNKTIVIQCRDAAGAAADPDNGNTLLIHIILRNTTN